MFFGDVKKEVYKKDMSLANFVKAAMPENAQVILDGKAPELALEGIAIDTAALDTFRQHMMVVGARVVKEKKEFEKAKKWLQMEYNAAQDVERVLAEARAEDKRMRGKFLPELLFTLLALGICALVLKILTDSTSLVSAMKVFKYISSTWFYILMVGGTVFGIVYTLRSAIKARFKNAGRVIRFVICTAVLLFCCVGTFSLFPNVIANNTYSISTKEELLAAKNFPRGTSFKLTADIDMEGEEIRYLFDEFHGEFWGNGYTISNVVLKKNARSGLIRENYGTVKNLKVDIITVHWNHKGGHYAPNYKVATLVAENYGTVTGACSITNVTYDHDDETDDKNQTVTLKSASYDTCRGHFVAFNAGTVHTEEFVLSGVSVKDRWDSAWSTYVGHTDMSYAVTPKE